MPLGQVDRNLSSVSETHPLIRIDRGNLPFTIQINVDLQDYCFAARILHDYREIVKNLEEELEKSVNQKLDFEKNTFKYFFYHYQYIKICKNNEKLIEQIKEGKIIIENKEKEFEVVRSKYIESVYGTIGGTYWYEVVNNLSQQLNDLSFIFKKFDLPQEQVSSISQKWNEFSNSKQKEDLLNLFGKTRKLSSILSSNQQPLVFEALQNSLIELIKNSIDAIIKKYIHHVSEQTDLQMLLDWEFDHDITVSISDNGGGLSEEALKKFKSYLKLDEYPIMIQSQKIQANNKYYLGGMGQGLSILFSLILDGTTIGGDHKKPLYVIPRGKTSASIDNIYKNNKLFGAKISLTTPYASFPLVSSLKKDEDEEKELQKTGESLKVLTSPSAFFNLQEWKNRHKRVKHSENTPVSPEENHSPDKYKIFN